MQPGVMDEAISKGHEAQATEAENLKEYRASKKSCITQEKLEKQMLQVWAEQSGISLALCSRRSNKAAARMI
jgi:hypothetical protein